LLCHERFNEASLPDIYLDVMIVQFPSVYCLQS
jgi:hypothetical protein